jgi:hypothetical protein
MAYKEVFNKLYIALTFTLILYYYLLELETIIEINAFNSVIARIFF